MLSTEDLEVDFTTFGLEPGFQRIALEKAGPIHSPGGDLRPRTTPPQRRSVKCV